MVGWLHNKTANNQWYFSDVRRVHKTETSPKVHKKTHQHKHQSTLKNIIRKKIQLLRSGLEQSHYQQLQMAISIDSKFWWLYKTPVQYWLTHPFTVHQRLRFHRGSGVLTKRDTLIPHISCVTSWNYTLISIYSSEYVGLYYTWKSGVEGGGGRGERMLTLLFSIWMP